MSLIRGIIVEIAKNINPKVYLELGAASGGTITQVSKFCGRAIGVDIREPKIKGSYAFYKMTTDEFFKRVKKNKVMMIPPPDLIFIDADHHCEQARKDFYNSLLYLSPRGIIILHDTFPEKKENTVPSLCGTVWKLAAEIRDKKEFEIFTFPYFPGLSLIKQRRKK